jgi:hypothetical protein
MQQYQTRSSQFLTPRQSHAGRNFGIAFLFLLLIIVFFAVPFVNVQSVNVPLGFGGVQLSLIGSLSYAMFKCGEVHLTGSSSVLGSTVASVDRYEWVCDGQTPSIAG